MKSIKTHDLNKIGVLVTRPAHQAEPLCQLIQQSNGFPIRFPALEIADIKNKTSLIDQIQRLHTFDLAIFISPNAVNKAIPIIRSLKNWPTTIKIAAVGKSSVKALDTLGLIADIFPSDHFNSEALLALKQMKEVKGKNIIIFRGEGGRELLADTLRSRGAQVEHAECYRRQKPLVDLSEILKHWKKGEIDIIVCTSNEGLQNLYEMIDQTGRKWLLNTAMVVVSERAADLAEHLGFKTRPLISTRASDDEILNSITLWGKMHGRENCQQADTTSRCKT